MRDESMIDTLHRRVFRHAPTARTHAIVGMLQWSVVGGIFAAGLVFAGNIAAGRLIGPAAYGRAAFAMTMAQLLTLVATGGMDLSASRAIARSTTPQERREVVSTTVAWVVVICVVMVAVGWVVARPVAELLGASVVSVRGALALLSLYSLKAVGDRLLGAYDWLRFQALVKPVEGVALAALLAIVVWGNDHRTAPAVIAASCVGAGLVVLAYLWRFRSELSASAVRRSTLLGLRSYARVVLISAVVPLPLLYADKLAVQHSLDDVSVGVYMAYASSSLLVAAQLLMLVNNVLFPVVARIEDKRHVHALLNRGITVGLLPFGGAVALLMVMLLHLFGSRYPIDGKLLLLFAAWSALHFANGLVHVVIMAHSRRAFLREAQFTAVRSLIYIGWVVALSATGHLRLDLVVGGLVALEVLEIAVLQFVIRRWVLGVPPDQLAAPAMPSEVPT